MYKRILLPVSNPINAKYSLKAALRLLDLGGTIVLLSVVGTREDYPNRAKSYSDKTNLVIRMMQVGQSDDIEIVPEVILASSVHDAILAQIATHQVDLAILGYSLQSTLYKIRYGDIIYPLMEEAPCDVILSNLKYESTFKRILVPSAGYRHSLAAVNVARTLAEGAQGHITLLHVTEDDESEVKADLERLSTLYDNVDINVRPGPVAETITSMAANYDIIIMGASERSRGASVIFGTVVDKVIEQTIRNIFVVRATISL
jgi:nucleotide-binding universal stress UspA family protein